MYSPRRLLKSARILLAGSAAERRRLRQEFARISAGLFGDFYIGDDHKMWRNDKVFIAKFKALSPHNYYSMERKWTLREFVRWTARLTGDIAECGCYVGVSAWFMASEMPPGESIFLFDSFEGLSVPSEEDRARFSDVQEWQKGDLCATEEELRKNLAGFGNIHVMKGWIPERFAEVSERRFRLVHIDVDLYEPTLASLEFFYSRLADSGVIVMDDYGYETCPGAYRAANEFAEKAGEYILHLSTGQGIIIKGRGRVLPHSYGGPD